MGGLKGLMVVLGGCLYVRGVGGWSLYGGVGVGKLGELSLGD